MYRFPVYAVLALLLNATLADAAAAPQLRKTTAHTAAARKVVVKPSARSAHQPTKPAHAVAPSRHSTRRARSIATPQHHVVLNKPKTPVASIPRRAPVLPVLSTLAIEPHIPDLEGLGGENLRRFFNRLRRLEMRQGNRDEHVRIMQIGDSHTAGDYFSHSLRAAFQQRFDNGGPGWLRPGDLKNYRSAQVSYQNSAAWRMFDSQFDRLHVYGLGGMLAYAEQPGASLNYTFKIEPPSAPSIMELVWRSGPDAGHVHLSADGRPLGEIATGGESGGWLHSRLDLDYAPHRLEVRTLDDKPVSLSGITLEYRQQGVVLDNIGTVGAQLNILSRWDASELRNHLTLRNPAFVILAFGTNEAFDPSFDSQRYRSTLQQTAYLLNSSAPTAAVLLLGPPDSMKDRQCGGSVQNNLSALRQVQRQVAAEQGWLYWDWSALMGGACSIAQWADVQLASRDHVHLTPQGYARSAQALFQVLMAQYERFVHAAL